MALVTGTLKDIGLETLSAFAPQLKLQPNQSAVGPDGSLFATKPVLVTPSLDGSFSVDLRATADLLPAGTYYTLSLAWLDPIAGFSGADFPEWKLRVPVAGGQLSTMLDAPADSSLLFIGDEPPADNLGFNYWINTSVFPPTFNIIGG